MMNLIRFGILVSAALSIQVATAQQPGSRNVTPGVPAHPVARVAQTSIIHAGKLLTIPGQAPMTNATLVVAEGKVNSIRDGFLDAATLGLPANTPVIDLSSKFVMPGMIDLHVHLTSSGIARDPALQLREGDSFWALNGATNAMATLMAGFTTVRDLGASDDSIFSLRDAIRLGVVPGPKIVAAGRGISPSNGHADSHGLRPNLLQAEAGYNVCNGADDCMRATREAIKYGADVIKVHITGGVLDESNAGTNQQFTDAEIAAIAWAAHSMGRKVTTHAHGKEGIDAAVAAGYDSIEHGMWADEATLREMKKRGTWLVPTVWPISWVGDTPEKVLEGPMRNINPNSLQKLLKLGDQPKKLIRMAIRIGTPIALGTDSGIAPHGTNAEEMLEYVDAGMSNMEALKTGTVNAAAAGGFDDRGSLEPGKAADVIALDDDPLVDIGAVLDVNFVMRDGIVFERAHAEVKE